MTSEDTGLAASIHQRLLNLSKARSLDFNLLLARFAIERFLYRLSQSPYADVFVLKGAMLLQVWLAETSRPTRDLDLLGFGDVSAERLRAVFAAVCEQPAAADGCQFHADSVTVAAIRAEDEYGGQRVTLSGHLGNARLRIQVDIGIGDSVTPPANGSSIQRCSISRDRGCAPIAPKPPSPRNCTPWSCLISRTAV